MLLAKPGVLRSRAAKRAGEARVGVLSLFIFLFLVFCIIYVYLYIYILGRSPENVMLAKLAGP